MKSTLLALSVVLLLGQSQSSVLRFNPREQDFLSSMKQVADKVLQEVDLEEQDSAWPPAFCNKLDCPKYTVLESTKDYELRQYEESHWVSTNLANIDYDSASYQLFMKLFNYISGNNVKKEKIAMTAPVLVSIIPGQGPACENNFTMSFFIAPKVSDAPSPSDSTVFLNQLPGLKAYVRSFGGFATKDEYINEALSLAKSLPEEAKYYSDFYYTAGYDAPFKLFNRHNEVWFIAK